MVLSDKEKFPYFFRFVQQNFFRSVCTFIFPLSTPIPRTVPSDIFQAKAMLEVLIISSSWLISTFCQNVHVHRFCGSWAGLMCLWSTLRLLMEQQGLIGMMAMVIGAVQFEYTCISTHNMTGIMMMTMMIVSIKHWRRTLQSFIIQIILETRQRTTVRNSDLA